MSTTAQAQTPTPEIPPAPNNVTQLGGETFTTPDGKTLPVVTVDGQKQAKDDKGNVYVLNGKEQRKQQKANKIQEKRYRQHMERRQRLINSGTPEDKVDQQMAQEDYNAMPPEKKIARLEQIIQGTFQQFAQELANLRHNDGVLADAMDLNFKAFSRMLAKLGLPVEEHKAFMQQAQQEMVEERMAEAAARRRAEEQQKLDAEKKLAEQALQTAEEPKLIVPEVTEAPKPPDGATEFGG